MTRIRNLMKDSLNSQLVAVSVIMSLITVGGACFFTYKHMKKVAINNTITHIDESINQMAERLSDKMMLILDQFGTIENDVDFMQIAGKQDGVHNLEDFAVLSEIFTDSHLQNSKMLDSILFLRLDGQIFHEYQYIFNSSFQYKEQPWYQKTAGNDGYIVWYPPYQNELLTNKKQETIGLMKMITDNRYNNLGILIMNLNINYFQNELEKLSLGPGTSQFIIDKENNIIISSDRDIEKCRKIMEQSDMEEDEIFKDISYEGQNTKIIRIDMGVGEWQIVGVIPENSLFNDAEMLWAGLIASILTGLVVSLFLLAFVLNRITIPITKLKATMRSMQNDETYIRFNKKEINRRDEIGDLARNFNAMMDRIDALVEQVRRESKMKSQAQLRALQQQINSHFLYNTLDTIYWKVISGDKTGSADMVKRLSTYFRLALNHGNDITTVRNEVQHIENYIAIEQYRYKYPIICKIDVDEDIYDFRMPKLLLQPLVENAVVHGIFTKKENGTILVRGYAYDHTVVFVVEDNGAGMDVMAINKYVKEDKKEEGMKKSFALRNIYTRINLFYKGLGSMDFYLNKDGGAGVRIELPADFEE
ncbi:MAG: histidine kinase [Clostridia bacterium]|nr:histidine kinase [Clostridia bacterium]